jgi:hypothetical protein
MNLLGTEPARLLGLALAALTVLATLVVFSPAESAQEAIGARGDPAGAPRPRVQALPSRPELALSASEFAQMFVEATTRYAIAHGDPARIRDPDCVKAAPGRYMCAYAVEKPGARRTCHLMQARLTPDAASSFVVTLAGGTSRCGSVGEAIASLP